MNASLSRTILAAGLALLAPLASARPAPPIPVQAQQSQLEQELEQGRAAMRSNDWATAMRVLSPLASQGEMEAQCLVALLHHKGYGVPQDFTEGVRWYTRSALQGWPDALFMLAETYYKGEGVPEDLQKAADLFLLCAITGDADGQWAFGVCVAFGEGRDRDPIEGYAWLSMASRQGQADAQQELSQLEPQMGAQDLAMAEEMADHWQGLVVNDGFDPEKMPVVPVPPFMSQEAQPRTPPRLRTSIQPTPAPQQGAEPEEQILVCEMTINAEMLPTGDMKGRAVVVLPGEVYGQLKELVPDPRLWLRDLMSGRSDQEVAPDAQASYDDARSAVVLDIHMLGAVHSRGDGLWEWEAENQTFAGVGTSNFGRTTATFDFASEDPEEGLAFRGKAIYTVPQGASDVSWSAAEGLLSYQLPYAGEMGQGRVKARFDARERLMSCLYKVYGLDTDFAAQWVGKAILTNTGKGPLTDLRVRFQLGTYSELDLWQKFPEVVPGQTVVAVYHPVLSRKIAELTSTTPTNLLCEWKWTDAEGRQHEDSDGGRISILGRHEFVFSSLTEGESTGSYFDAFSNADFAAAWVSRDDPVVKQFAAAANKAAGGEGAPYSDEAAWKVLKACYEIWQANDFTYQGPVGLVDPNMSFDNNIVQSMKFPRDVIRDRSGTCIELTCLYCSMVQAIGLKTYMVLIPGHAFPAVQLPSGNYLPVESTGVGGGKRYGTSSFEQVVQIATENYQKAEQDGRIIVVDIESAWNRGVSNPELEAVPADILQRWGTVLEFTLSPDQGGPAQASGPVQPTDGPTPPPGGASPLGKWAGQASQPLPDGRNFTWPMVIEVTQAAGGGVHAEFYGEAQIPNEWGGTTSIQVMESFDGQMQGGQVVMRGTTKTVTIDGQRQPMPPDDMTLAVQSGKLQGTVQLAEGGTLTFTAEPQQ